MANFSAEATLLLALVLGLCGAELFMNTNYNKYGTNPYLAPVFNSSSPSVPQPSEVQQSNPSPSVPSVQQEATGNANNPPQTAVNKNDAIPEPAAPTAQSNPVINEVIPQKPVLASDANSQNVQPGSVVSSTVAPVVPNDPLDGQNKANVLPQNPVASVPNPVSVAQSGSTQLPSFPPAQPAVNPVPAPSYQNPLPGSFYPVSPTGNPSNVQPQNPFAGGSQASFPAPNFSGNPYLQGLIPGGSNPQNVAPVLPQNPQNAIPVPPIPQNAVPVPPVVLPQNPQNAIPQNPPQPAFSNNNPYLQNQTPPPSVPPTSSNVPPQNAPAPGASINLNNNPYLQNLNPAAVPAPQNPQQEVPNQSPPPSQNSNPFFPSIPVSSPVPQTPTQSYPTPCTNIPNGIPSSTQNFVPGYSTPAQFPQPNAAQGTTLQPHDYYPSTIAAKHLRSRCLRPRGQFPSDKCNFFVNCWDNDVREQPCPPGLAFSSKGYCDFAGNVDCNGLPLAVVPAAKPEGEQFSSPQPGLSFASQPSFVPQPQAPASSQPILPAAAPTVQVVQNLQPSIPVQPVQPSNVPQPTVSPVSQPTVAQPVPSSVATQATAVPAIPSSLPTVAAPVEAAPSSSVTPPSPQPNSAVTIPAALPEQSTASSVPVSSSVAPTAAPVPSTTVDPVLKAKCLKPRGQFPTEICNRYINCWDDAVREEECPKGMAFSERGYCDFDFSVNCGNRTYDKKTTYDATSNCPAPHGTFRDKSNCSQYYTCMFGQVVAKYSCPSSLSYNDVLGVCDYSDKVDCSHAPLMYPPTENHVVMQEIKEGAPNTSKCTPGSIYRLNPQCTSAVLCRYGFTEIVECPSGLAYDSVTDKCLLPHLAKC